MISHKYGSTFLKTPIAKKEYEIIKSSIDQLIQENKIEIKYKNIENLFNYCYEHDENDTSDLKSYKLKTVETILRDIDGIVSICTSRIIDSNSLR